ncbi:MAG: hypothetical protein ACXADA_24380 [Candidatus Hodarchaeales archaeon]
MFKKSRKSISLVNGASIDNDELVDLHALKNVYSLVMAQVSHYNTELFDLLPVLLN